MCKLCRSHGGEEAMNQMGGSPLGDVLVRIGTELSEAAVSVDDLHAIVEAAISNGGATDSLMRQAQTIDILQQHLHALAQFIGELSTAVPPGCRIESSDAMNNLKLSGLRLRLSELCCDPLESHDAGDLHMF